MSPTNLQVRDIHNLTAFPSDLHFLFCVAIGLEFIDMRNDIERKGVGKYFVARHFPCCRIPYHVRLEFANSLVMWSEYGMGK